MQVRLATIDRGQQSSGGRSWWRSIDVDNLLPPPLASVGVMKRATVSLLTRMLKKLWPMQLQIVHCALFKLLQTHVLPRILSEDKLKQHCLRNKCYLFHFNLDNFCALKK